MLITANFLLNKWLFKTIIIMMKCNSYFSPSSCHKQAIAPETADDCSDLILHLNLYNPTLTSLPVIPFCELPITDILYKKDVKKRKGRRSFLSVFSLFLRYHCKRRQRDTALANLPKETMA